MSFGISEKSCRQLQRVLEEFSEIEEALIFGSRALGTEKPGSDIDLAIKGAAVTPQTALSLAARLNESLPIPYFCDVVDYASIDNPALKEHIDRHGRSFFKR